MFDPTIRLSCDENAAEYGEFFSGVVAGCRTEKRANIVGISVAKVE